MRFSRYAVLAISANLACGFQNSIQSQASLRGHPINMAENNNIDLTDELERLRAASKSAAALNDVPLPPLSSIAPVVTPLVILGAGRAELERRSEVRNEIQNIERQLAEKKKSAESTGSFVPVAFTSALLGLGLTFGGEIVQDQLSSNKDLVQKIAKEPKKIVIPASMARQQAEAKRIEEERLAKEKAEAEAKLAAEKAAREKAELEAKLAAEKKAAEEKAAKEKAALEAKIAAEKKAAEEKAAAERAAQEAKAAEEKRLAAEAAQKKAAEEKAAQEKAALEAKIAAEKKAAEEKAAAERAAQQAKEAAEKKIAAEKAAREKAELEAKIAAEKKAAEEKLAAEKKAAEEKRLAEEKAAKEKAELEAKQAAEKKAAEEKAAKEKAELEAKQAAEKKAAEDKKAAEEKAAKETAELAAKQAAEKKAAEEKAAKEKAALAAKQEAEKKAAEKKPAEQPKSGAEKVAATATAAATGGGQKVETLDAEKAARVAARAEQQKQLKERLAKEKEELLAKIAAARKASLNDDNKEGLDIDLGAMIQSAAGSVSLPKLDQQMMFFGKEVPASVVLATGGTALLALGAVALRGDEDADDDDDFDGGSASSSTAFGRSSTPSKTYSVSGGTYLDSISSGPRPTGASGGGMKTYLDNLPQDPRKTSGTGMTTYLDALRPRPTSRAGTSRSRQLGAGSNYLDGLENATMDPTIVQRVKRNPTLQVAGPVAEARPTFVVPTSEDVLPSFRRPVDPSPDTVRATSVVPPSVPTSSSYLDSLRGQGSFSRGGSTASGQRSVAPRGTFMVSEPGGSSQYINSMESRGSSSFSGSNDNQQQQQRVTVAIGSDNESTP